MSEAVFSVKCGSDGKSEIKINTPKGSEVKTTGDTYMVGVEEKSSGGKITHQGGKLHQINISQKASNKGEIVNEAESIVQEGIEQSADNEGIIINRIKNNQKEVQELLTRLKELESKSQDPELINNSRSFREEINKKNPTPQKIMHFGKILLNKVVDTAITFLLNKLIGTQ